jgi:hypothetical protein
MYYRLAAIIWIILSTTLAGLAMIVIVSVPELADDAKRLIPLLCGGAFVLAIPLSVLVAKRISSKMAGSAA